MSLRVLIIAALITAFAPLSMDLYLPSLPDIRPGFHASGQQAQLTVTGCIIGLALGQFLIGVVPERWGRRRLLLVGMSVWIAATELCPLASSIVTVTGIRVVQGLGACRAWAPESPSPWPGPCWPTSTLSTSRRTFRG